MSQQVYKETTIKDWARSECYFDSQLLPEDPLLDATVEKNMLQALPDIAVTATQGKFLNLLLRSIGAKRVLEIGTLGGYSTIWLARAIPDGGQVVTLELDENYAQVAAENIANASLSSKVKIIQGRAIDTLATLEPLPPFDLVFIDADKPSNLEYFHEGKRLVRSGGVIIVDNVVRYGRVSDPEYKDDKVEGVRRLLHSIQYDEQVDATVLQTVGAKGYDGFLYAFKK